MHTETYISEKELQTKFRIAQAYKPNFGKFVATRWLYSITANGGKTWQRFLFFLLFTLALSPLALTADFCGLAVFGLLVLAKKFLEGVLVAVLTVGQRFLGTAAVIGALIGSILILYYKWDVITSFVKGLF